MLASNLNLEVAKNRFFFLGWLRAGTVHYGCEIISEGESLFLFICFTVWAVKKVITEKFHGGRFLWNRN